MANQAVDVYFERVRRNIKARPRLSAVNCDDSAETEAAFVTCSTRPGTGRKPRMRERGFGSAISSGDESQSIAGVGSTELFGTSARGNGMVGITRRHVALVTEGLRGIDRGRAFGL